MRADRCTAWALLLLCCGPAAAGAQSPLAAEIRALGSRYHEDPARIDTLREGMAAAAASDPQVENLLALAQIAFLFGDVRARTPEDKLAAYEQPPLDEAIRAEMEEFVVRRRAELGD